MKIEQAVQTLNNEFKRIHDFNVVATPEGRIKGGFYKMRFFDRLADNGWVEYYFHETFFNTNNEDVSEEDIQYMRARINKQLVWQKQMDEDYAAEFNKEVKYMFEY